MLFDNLVAGIIHIRNVIRRNRPIIVKISFSTILVLGLGPDPCVGAVIVMAWLVRGVLQWYTLPAPQKKGRPYRTITEWDTMPTDENSNSLQLESTDKRNVLVSKPRPIVFDSC